MHRKLKLTPDQLAQLVNQRGGEVQRAAREAGVSPSWAARILRDAGYERRVYWTRQEKAS